MLFNTMMNRCMRWSLLLLAGACIQGVAAQEIPATMAEALKRAGIPAKAVAVYVQEVGTAKPMVTLNAAAAFNPASTMKLVTSNAALDLLGPTFIWKTQAYASGTQVGDVLQGDLIFKGSGDPKLVMENLWMFLRRIRARGIREIGGNVLLDRSAFEENGFDSAKFDGDPMKPYNAGPDALLLNYKTFSFRFIPDIARGVVNVTVDPPAAGFAITAPRLSQSQCGDWQENMRPAITPQGATFSGAYSSACEEKVWHIHPARITHTQYFGLVFRQIWSDLGGTLKGDVRNGHVAQGARLIDEWESPTLPDVIRDMNKYSNNVMARQVLLTLAADVLKLPASQERGMRVIKSWFANKGIDASELVIENGSGLSRVERISAATMGRMLVLAFQSPLMPELMSSMPLVGYDGTMRKRLTTSGVAGNAHIKSGTLNDVRAVAGYLLAASGKRYAVVCFINHANAPRGRDAQDALLQWVYEKG